MESELDQDRSAVRNADFTIRAVRVMLATVNPIADRDLVPDRIDQRAMHRVRQVLADSTPACMLGAAVIVRIRTGWARTRAVAGVTIGVQRDVDVRAVVVGRQRP